jgi:hypothetical protein
LTKTGLLGSGVRAWLALDNRARGRRPNVLQPNGIATWCPNIFDVGAVICWPVGPCRDSCRRWLPFRSKGRRLGRSPTSCRLPQLIRRSPISKSRGEIWASRNMEMFALGEKQTAINRNGAEIFRGEYALHVQCAWHIVRRDRLVVASSDVDRPFDGDADGSDDCDWEVSGSNRRDSTVTAGEVTARGTRGRGGRVPSGRSRSLPPGRRQRWMRL